MTCRRSGGGWRRVDCSGETGGLNAGQHWWLGIFHRRHFLVMFLLFLLLFLLLGLGRVFLAQLLQLLLNLSQLQSHITTPDIYCGFLLAGKSLRKTRLVSLVGV